MRPDRAGTFDSLSCLGLVGALGFLLLVSLVISTLLAALGEYMGASFTSAYVILHVLGER